MNLKDVKIGGQSKLSLTGLKPIKAVLNKPKGVFKRIEKPFTLEEKNLSNMVKKNPLVSRLIDSFDLVSLTDNSKIRLDKEALDVIDKAAIDLNKALQGGDKVDDFFKDRFVTVKAQFRGAQSLSKRTLLSRLRDSLNEDKNALETLIEELVMLGYLEQKGNYYHLVNR